MTDKQQKFCEEYLIDCNATRAYKAAYPSVVKDETARANASRLLSNANVRCYLDKRLAELSEQRIAKAEEILGYLTDVMRGKTMASVLALCGDGCQEVIEKPPDMRERLKAAELLGKRYGLFTDKMDVSGAVPVVIMGDDQLED